MNPNDQTRSAQPAPGTQTNATFIPPPDEQARIAAGAVPGFEIESTLGYGAFGVVYRAKQTGLNRTVALKMLIAGPFASDTARARFLLEAESVAALEHPGIVKVFAFGESGRHPYLAMEFVPGGTLAGRIKTAGPLPARDATELVAKLADAVAHAHSRGVVHRDIKPHNVLLTAGGEPRLTDFGLAKVGRSDMTVTGQVLGTPAYMAPEQAAGKVHEVGTHSDVYALGAVLYDVLTGRPPFVGDSAAVTLQKVISEEPERPRKLNAGIPRDLETICLKCLEKHPAKRYLTAAELESDLNAFLQGRPIGARPTRPAERVAKWARRRPGRAALVVGVGILAIGLPVAVVQWRAKVEADRAAAEITIKNEIIEKLEDDRYQSDLRVAQANWDVARARVEFLLQARATERDRAQRALAGATGARNAALAQLNLIKQAVTAGVGAMKEVQDAQMTYKLFNDEVIRIEEILDERAERTHGAQLAVAVAEMRAAESRYAEADRLNRLFKQSRSN